jgi:hypothetical protein
MRAAIRYVPEDIVLDLGRQDLGHPDGRKILERHYHQSEQSHPEFNGQNPAFVCLRHDSGTNPGIFLKRIGEQWWAWHYERSRCGSMRVPAPMSDEHKRQADYWARAGVDAGWPVEMERALPTGTRPDVLIHGPVDTGIEVQRYAMTVPAAVRRSHKAQLGNVLDVWFTNRTPAPKWTYKVPSVMENSLPWDVVPRRRTALATGLRSITPVRCSVENFPRCPETGGRQCEKDHPADEPWRGLLIDDVAAQVPAGEIVPMRFRRNSRTSDVFLVSPASLALYEDMTGRKAGFSFGPYDGPLRQSRPAGEVECHNDQPDDPATVRCFRCRENVAGPGGILCLLCRLDIEASDGYAPARHHP